MAEVDTTDFFNMRRGKKKQVVVVDIADSSSDEEQQSKRNRKKRQLKENKKNAEVIGISSDESDGFEVTDVTRKKKKEQRRSVTPPPKQDPKKLQEYLDQHALAKRVYSDDSSDGSVDYKDPELQRIKAEIAAQNTSHKENARNIAVLIRPCNDERNDIRDLDEISVKVKSNTHFKKIHKAYTERAELEDIVFTYNKLKLSLFSTPDSIKYVEDDVIEVMTLQFFKKHYQSFLESLEDQEDPDLTTDQEEDDQQEVDERDMVTVSLRNGDDIYSVRTLPKTATVGKLIQHYKTKMEIEGEVKLKFDGEWCTDEQTWQDLGIEDEDQFDVILQ